ncbi:thrombomodulin-like [Acipenser ruthenus]|uniref:thrombomodulin-like n=1 Tax=Acipenser ruthenus TaxID=7906 RepID=UPI00145AEC96|nr:thrombomodulin-like [Acipenser ruthenus]
MKTYYLNSSPNTVFLRKMFKEWATVTATLQLLLLQVTGQAVKSGLCIGNDCYTIHQDSKAFQNANDVCSTQQGHLMTVRSTVANDAMATLMANEQGDFWIGLQLPEGQCTKNDITLRGYEWVTGEESTRFSNWKGNDSTCTQQCVSVSSDLIWEERPCQDKLAGFLCEYNFNKTCEALPADTDLSILYSTPLGFQGADLRSLPPASTATCSPSGFKVYCSSKGDWMMGPWDCQIDNGGCEHQCQMINSQPQCICPPGSQLKDNKVACTEIDICSIATCEHTCVPHNDSYFCRCQDGYDLDPDGKRCRDIDECIMKQAGCRQDQVCVNTPGSSECKCKPGFKEDDGKCEDLDECSSSPCEHKCINVLGSYQCSCFEGYSQDSKYHHKCKPLCFDIECPAVDCVEKTNSSMDCNCYDGFVLDTRENGYFCVDINECEMGTYCDQLCDNSFGSYTCYCQDGYSIDSDEYSCVPEDTEEGSGTTGVTPVISVLVTPTSNYTVEGGTLLTSGALLGIIICIVVMTLVLVFLVHHILKQRTKWDISSDFKSSGAEREVGLQQVTTEKYIKIPLFLNRNSKTDMNVLLPVNKIKPAIS